MDLTAPELIGETEAAEWVYQVQRLSCSWTSALTDEWCSWCRLPGMWTFRAETLEVITGCFSKWLGGSGIVKAE